VVPRKIDLGEALAALGALLLLVGLFLEWFDGATAWEAFESLDLVLLLLALTVLAAVAGVFDWLGARLLAPLGLVLLLVVVTQLIEPPPAVGDGDLGAGAWLGLAGAGLVLLGGALRVASVSVTINVGGKDARRRVDAVDRRHDVAPATTPAAAAPPPAPDEPTQAFSPVEDPPRP
jgi:peptidoglycan/LPS O-acetylase OafA/YrhL